MKTVRANEWRKKDQDFIEPFGLWDTYITAAKRRSRGAEQRTRQADGKVLLCQALYLPCIAYALPGRKSRLAAPAAPRKGLSASARHLEDLFSHRPM